MTRSPFVLAGTAFGLSAVVIFDARQPTVTGPPASSRSGVRVSAASAPGTRAVVGDAVATRVGTVQVKAIFTHGRLVDVIPLQLTDASSVSVQISDYAAPRLREAALTRQSAAIDAVSGATVTSDAYKTSLQSALDRAALGAGDGTTLAATPPARTESRTPASTPRGEEPPDVDAPLSRERTRDVATGGGEPRATPSEPAADRRRSVDHHRPDGRPGGPRRRSGTAAGARPGAPSYAPQAGGTRATRPAPGNRSGTPARARWGRFS